MSLTPAALVVLLAVPTRAEPTRIGAAGGVTGKVTASAPGAAARSLASGGAVYHKDSVATDSKGRLQVMLLDETVFTVGPDSEIVLDEFVYDPFTEVGKVSAQVSKGVFRFVTGNVARKKPSNMKVKVPSGTIGIRGTIVGGKVGAKTLIALLGPGGNNNAGEREGGATVDTPKGPVELNEPGTGLFINPDGTVEGPFVLTPELLASLDVNGGGRDQKGDAADKDPSQESGKDSGQDNAQAKETSESTKDAGDTRSDRNAQADKASQDSQGLAEGLARWDDVRAIESGLAHYEGSGSFDLNRCFGGDCANNSAGSMSISLNIDFGARTVGGNCGGLCGASVVSGTDNDNTDIAVNPSVNIPLTSFASLTGDARLSAVNGNASTTIDLLNHLGQRAGQAQAKLYYDDGNSKASGVALADRQAGSVAIPP